MKFKKTIVVFALVFFVCVVGTNAQTTTYTFTPCGATGSVGPTQTQITTAYANTNLSLTASTNANSGIQTFTVPASGLYRIDAAGASGGNTNTTYNKVGGMGARMIGEYNLIAGDVLRIIVGEKGINGCGSAGGGGGSFVTRNNVIIHAVGGGGGATSDNNANNASLLTSGTTDFPTVSLGGSNGNGGLTCQNQVNNGGGGGGYLTDGQSGPSAPTGYGGQAFVNGGLGGPTNPNTNFMGGFGGGGSSTNCTCGGGGGGGYSGGAGGQQVGYCNPNVTRAGGGGGGSLNTGINQVNSIMNVQGDGFVVITALCNITVASTTSLVCIGNSATITTNAISNYAWSTGGTGPSIVVTPSVTTVYTLSAMSPSNCIASAAITITVNTTPTVSAVINTSIICLGKTVIMTAIGANTYTWTGGATNAVPYAPTAIGNYTYTVTGNNACGNSTAAVSATVLPLPSITASVNNPTVCNGGSIILNGGGSVSGYTWNAGAPNNTAFVPPATFNYIVTGVAANGCTNTAVAGVTVLVTPTIVPVATPTAMCIGLTASLSAVGATGYTWTPGTLPNAPTVTVSPLATTIYTLFRTNGACSSTSTLNLIIYPLPFVSANATPNQICPGTAINMSVVGPITNTWLPGGFTSANFNLYPNFSTCYTVTGSNGNCTNTAVVCLTVNPSPTITLSASTPTVCQGGNVTLTGGGGLTYTWQPMNTNNTVEVVTPTVTSLYTLAGSNSFGCSSSVNQVIVAYPLPDMTLISSLPYICVGQTSQLSIPNSSPNVAYNWSTGASGTTIPASPSITTTYFATGINSITGCTNTNTITLSVYIATFAVTSPTAICKGETATLSANGAAASYVWTGGATSSSITVSPVINTVYNVVGTTGSCTFAASVPLTVNPIPNVTAVTAKGTICRFEVSTITGNGATSYSWSTGATTPTISFNLSVTTNYTLTGTDLNNCSKTQTVTQYVATCIGIESPEANSNIGLNVYPNPNSGNFILSSEVNINLNIINALGQVVDSVSLAEVNQYKATVNNLANGIYFITGETNGFKVNKKIIVEK